MFQGGKKQHAHVPSGYVKIAIENDHLQWIYPLKMVIFHNFVYVYQRVKWYPPTTAQRSTNSGVDSS